MVGGEVWERALLSIAVSLLAANPTTILVFLIDQTP
jgi:hypothetical protein